MLDEVEAALDEANVSRFGHYLSDFQNDTQFIVVTHRKGTMEAADVLYGVTMQESGVSKTVSVRFGRCQRRRKFCRRSRRSSKMIKLVAIDLDGTLLDGKKQVSQKIKKFLPKQKHKE